MITEKNQWYPIAASDDLVPRHVFDAQLLGQEMAVWRADDGYANIWENRCLHRGVRLTIGSNDGSELKCQYHGWRYANRTASCTYIPAHPADAPSRTVCNKTYVAAEKYGLVWTALESEGNIPDIEALNGVGVEALRGIPVNAPADLVLSYIVRLELDKSLNLEIVERDAVSVSFISPGNSNLYLICFIQPVDSARAAIRTVATGLGKGDSLDIALMNLNFTLSMLRDACEMEAKNLPEIPPMEQYFGQVSENLATMPDRNINSGSEIRVQVIAKTKLTPDVTAFDLKALEGTLPTAQAGAHIDVQLPNGLTRQYSITNGAGETEIYRIGVKREPESRGGSECLHETIREGDVLAVSRPRNNFPLRRDAEKTIFIAGGIGITPLLSMAKTLDVQDQEYDLHYFVRNSEHRAFGDQLDALKSNVIVHEGLGPKETGDALTSIFTNRENSTSSYICGPGPMLDAARTSAVNAGWPESEVHFEYFKNTNEIDDSSSFEIALARSGQTLQVSAGETILEVLRANGISLGSSCEQGACGTCKIAVIEGEVDHQDVHLTEGEKRENAYIITCVSRAKSDRLVLDI